MCRTAARSRSTPRSWRRISEAAIRQGVFPDTRAGRQRARLLPNDYFRSARSARAVSLLVYAILGLAITWALYVLYMQVATRAAEGRSAAPLYGVFPDLATVEGPALVYCFSPNCGPCRPMSKEVDILAAQGAAVFKLDISRYPDLVSEFGIRATPTLILIDQGAVARMLLGVRTADAMSELITTSAR